MAFGRWISTIAGLATATALIACGGSSGASPTQRSATATGTHEATTPARTATSTTTVTHTVTTAADPVSSTAAAASAASGAYCSSKDLGIHYFGGQGAAGSFIEVFAFVNTSAIRCRLRGYPGMGALSNSGHALALRVRRQAAPVRDVVLAPGRSAAFKVQIWKNRNSPKWRCVHARTLEFTPPNDTIPERIVHPQSLCGTPPLGVVEPVGSAPDRRVPTP